MLRFGNKTALHTFSDSLYMQLYVNVLSSHLSMQHGTILIINKL